VDAERLAHGVELRGHAHSAPQEASGQRPLVPLRVERSIEGERQIEPCVPRMTDALAIGALQLGQRIHVDAQAHAAEHRGHMDETTASLWQDAILLPVGHTEAFGLRVSELASRVSLEEAIALGDHALALHAADRVVCLELPFVLVGAVHARDGVELPRRFHAPLVKHAPRAKILGIVPLAGRALRLVEPSLLAVLDDAAWPDAVLLGHIGGSARASRLVARVAAWPKGAYTALKKAAASTHKRTFEQTYGYSSAEHDAHWIEGLAACGADAIAPLCAALAEPPPSAPLLYAALGSIGGAEAVATIATGLASPTAATRTAARAGFDALEGVDASAAHAAALSLARGAAASRLQALAIAAPVVIDPGLLEALRRTEGAAAETRDPSLDTLRALVAYWAEHLEGKSWFSPRPAIERALVAHASLEGAFELAVGLLEQIPRGAPEVIAALVDAFGEARVVEAVRAIAARGTVAKKVAKELAHYLGEVGAEAKPATPKRPAR
jgi:hypothetical protein